MGSSTGSSSESFNFVTACQWEAEVIQEWLRKATEGCVGADQNLKELWTEFLGPHFKGVSLRLTPDKKLHPMKISLKGVSFNIYSSWCALAVVLNLKLPPYDPSRGSTLNYACTILFLLAKWSCSIKTYLPKKFSPPVYSVFFAEGDQLLTGEGLVTIISTAKCINLDPGKENTTLFNDWDAGRLGQLVELFDNKDNPLCKDNSWLIKKGSGECGLRAPSSFKNIKKEISLLQSGSMQNSVNENTLELYISKQKLSEDSDLHDIKQCLGSCSETWGFMMMSRVVKRGGSFTSISVSSHKPEGLELLENYEVGDFKAKLACYNCVYLSSAFEAKYGIVLEEYRGKRSANPPPAPPAIRGTSTTPPQGSQDYQMPEDTPSSSQAKRPISEIDPEMRTGQPNKRHRGCM